MGSDAAVRARKNYLWRASEIAADRFHRMEAVAKEGSVSLIELEDAELEMLRAEMEWEEWLEKYPGWSP